MALLVEKYIVKDLELPRFIGEGQVLRFNLVQVIHPNLNEHLADILEIQGVINISNFTNDPTYDEIKVSLLYDINEVLAEIEAIFNKENNNE